MENIKSRSKSKEPSKRLLLETIDFLRYKIENETLTAGECASLARLVAQSLELSGTAEDFARFFGKSTNNVKVVICRKLDCKPARRVLYPFARFCEVVPETWWKEPEEKQ